MSLPALLDIIYTGQCIYCNRLTRLLNRKTDIYEVLANESYQCLAKIAWYAPWRKYAFFPIAVTVWEPICLRKVTTFLDNLIHEWKGAHKHAHCLE